MTLTKKQWQAIASKLLKTELFEKDMSYKELAKKLNGIGVEYDDRSLANRINRGTFTCVFLIQCLVALNTDTIKIPKELFE